MSWADKTPRRTRQLAEKLRSSLSSEQRRMLDYVVDEVMAGRSPTRRKVADGLGWPVDQVERVGRELVRLDMLDLRSLN